MGAGHCEDGAVWGRGIVRTGQCGGGVLWDSCKQLTKTFGLTRAALKYSSTDLCTAHQVKLQCL